MSHYNFEKGRQLIEDQKYAEGEYLMRQVLRDPEVSHEVKAFAWTWIAVTKPERRQKLDCYRAAVALDPQNAAIRAKLERMERANLTMPPESPSPDLEPSRGTHPLDPAAGLLSETRPSVPPTEPRNPYAEVRATGIYPSIDHTPPYGNTYDPRAFAVTPGYDPRLHGGGAGYPPDPRITTGGYASVNPNFADPNAPYGGMGMARNPAPTSPIAGSMGGGGFGEGITPAWGVPSLSDSTLLIPHAQATVGIRGGKGGPGTGFFITNNGIIATARSVVGDAEYVQVELLSGQTLAGRILRSYPNFDLAYIKLNVIVQQLEQFYQVPMLPDNVPLVVRSHRGKQELSRRRQTNHAFSQHWIPLELEAMDNADGSPVIHGSSGAIVGMLTSNRVPTNRGLMALHIVTIINSLSYFFADLQTLSGREAYCAACGSISRAPNYGGHYCETCGTTLAASRDRLRTPRGDLAGLYGEGRQIPCPSCNSRAGFYANRCLRCGTEMA